MVARPDPLERPALDGRLRLRRAAPVRAARPRPRGRRHRRRLCEPGQCARYPSARYPGAARPAGDHRQLTTTASHGVAVTVVAISAGCQNIGTKPTPTECRRMSAFEGKADIAPTGPHFGF